MKQIDLSLRGMEMDYKTANLIARAVAGTIDHDPTVIAWHDQKRGKMSPVIEGADVSNRWRDYGEAYGGDVAVSVNGDYDFIFAEGETFEQLGEGPYISLQDTAGHEYLCLPEYLRDPKNPQENACVQLDDTGTLPSGLHEG